MPTDWLSPVRLRDRAAIWREVGDEVIVLTPGSSSYVALNPSAAAIWRRLAQGCTSSDLVDDLVDRFVVAPTTAGEDVEGFLAILRDWQLLED